MLAGGVGYANMRDALKGDPAPGEKVVLLGGDNYRIGMGGGAVSSVNTGQYTSGIELKRRTARQPGNAETRFQRDPCDCRIGQQPGYLHP